MKTSRRGFLGAVAGTLTSLGLVRAEADVVKAGFDDDEESSSSSFSLSSGDPFSVLLTHLAKPITPLLFRP